MLLQTIALWEGELERLQELQAGLQNDLARYHEREALLDQVCLNRTRDWPGCPT